MTVTLHGLLFDSETNRTTPPTKLYTTFTQDNPSTEESLAHTSDRSITTRRPLMRPVTKTYVLMFLSLSTDRLTSPPHVPELLDQQGVFLNMVTPINTDTHTPLTSIDSFIHRWRPPDI